MFEAFTKRGETDEVSLRGLERRWSFLTTLPDPDGPLPEELEEDRIRAVEAC
ncbi:MAG: hypothetical protein AAF264_03450 [Pseudomonadota bacterium]